MPRSITERHEIVVETDESVFVLTADSREGRLVIQQKRKRGSSEICSLSLANPDELEAFFEGLRRVFSSTGGARERTVPPRESAQNWQRDRMIPADHDRARPGAGDRGDALGHDLVALLDADRRRVDVADVRDVEAIERRHSMSLLTFNHLAC